MDNDMRIMVIDQHFTYASTMFDNLRKNPDVTFNITYCPSVEDALSKLAASDFDAIILDPVLDDQDPLDIFDIVYDAAPKIPIIVFSESITPKLHAEIVTEGAIPVPKSDECLQRIDIMLIQIIARKRSEARGSMLADAQHRLNNLSQFIQDISHDLQNPLGAISLIISQLKLLQDKDPDFIEQRLDRIDSNAQKVSRLVQDISILSKLENKNDITYTSVKQIDLVNCVYQSMMDLEVKAKEMNQSIELVYEGDIIMILGNKRQLSRVFENLISNAIRYTPQGGEITILIRRDEDSAIVEVNDTGIGIGVEDIHLIFERYYRAPTAAQTVREGSGLGLAIVKKVVEFHGGRISVESEIGRGSSFKIELPCYTVVNYN